jgi:hypothetical protein
MVVERILKTLLFLQVTLPIIPLAKLKKIDLDYFVVFYRCFNPGKSFSSVNGWQGSQMFTLYVRLNAS